MQLHCGPSVHWETFRHFGFGKLFSSNNNSPILYYLFYCIKEFIRFKKRRFALIQLQWEPSYSDVNGQTCLYFGFLYFFGHPFVAENVSYILIEEYVDCILRRVAYIQLHYGLNNGAKMLFRLQPLGIIQISFFPFNLGANDFHIFKNLGSLGQYINKLNIYIFKNSLLS